MLPGKLLLHILLFFAVAASSLSSLRAATFTGNQGGLLGNSSVINADGSGDYQSLKDAVNDYSQYPNRMEADYTFYIASDLMETGPIQFKTRITSRTINIKPLASPRTISITSTIPFIFPIVSAGIQVGPDGVHQVHIDGTVDEMGTKGLHFKHHLVTSSNYLFRDSDACFAFNCLGAFKIRNCTFEQSNSGPVASCVLFISPMSLRYDAEISHCEILTSDTIRAGIVMSRGSNQYSVTNKVQISDNIISGTKVGIHVQDIGSTITRNQIRLTGNSTHSQPLVGIAANPNSSLTSHTEVTRNSIHISGGDSAGVIQGIRSCSGRDYEGVMLIQNNMVSINVEPSTGSRPVMGITLVNRRASVTEVSHNSIYLPGNQYANEDVGRRFHGLGVDARSSNTAVLANNMLRVESPEASGLFYDGGNTITSNGNVIGAFSPAVCATDDSTTYTLLSDWQSFTGRDGNSQSHDPLTLWESADDLHVTKSSSGVQPGVTGLLQYPATVDIDGDARTETISPGADEMNLGAEISQWADY